MRRIPNCEKVKVPKPFIFIMSSFTTPNKIPNADTTFVECSWAFSSTGSLYVRLSPLVAESLRYKKQVHFKRLGSVQKVYWSAKLKVAQAKHSCVFKIEVDTRTDDESQDVDVPATVLYALKEEQFCDFGVDAQAKKLFAGHWKGHTQLLAAHKHAMTNKQLGKKGDWLKKAFKSELQSTQTALFEEEDEQATSSTVTSAQPEAFAFNMHQ